MKTMQRKTFMLLITVLTTAALACSLGGATGGDSGDGSGQSDGANSGGGSGAPVLDIAGVGEVELLTPAEGVGIKPLFEWAAVEGVQRYLLILRDANGETYWAWNGSATSIYLGGVSEQPSDDAEGPRLEAGMAWAVFALDSEGEVIASSELRPISP
jgi:hypothetical protein